MTTITLFGSTGDLSYRKLLPALYNMYSNSQTDFQIIAIGRKDYTTKDYLQTIQTGIQEYTRLAFDEEIFKKFSKRIIYYQMDLTNKNSYVQFNEFIKQQNIQDQIFYLALSPQFFHQVIEGLKMLDHIEKNRVVIEKPFGESTEDMNLINQKLKEIFEDDHLYYIDHYLGKEMVQNIKTIRFKNALFKSNWNQDMIESIQISALEKDGILNRGAYYEKSGALKDMVQNHIFQIVTILTMEEQKNQHEAQLDILHHLHVEKMILGQYKGYKQEKNVSPDSTTETYAELECRIQKKPWENVPIFIRTGKKLNRREIYVVIKFRSFDGSPNNLLEIKIQPTEGVYLQFNIKKPQEKNEIQTVKMDFCQSCLEVNRINTPQAYERLLKEVIRNSHEYFSSFEEILTSSRLIEEIEKPEPFIYENQIENSLTDWIEIPHTLDK